MTTDKLLTVTVKSPKREEFKGTARSVTANNAEGKFDILPYHASFITLIKDYVIVREQNNKEITFPLTSGIVKVYEDNVHILIGI